MAGLSPAVLPTQEWANRGRGLKIFRAYVRQPALMDKVNNRILTASMVAILLVSGCEKSPPPPPPEPPALSEPLYFDGAKIGDEISYLNLVDEQSNMNFQVKEDPNVPGGFRWKYYMTPDGRQQMVGEGGIPSGDWLKQIFEYEAIDSIEDGTFSVGGRSVEGKLVSVSKPDGSALKFEMSPDIPLGGLIRVHRFPADSEEGTILFELRSHTPTAMLKAVDSPQYEPSPDGKVVYYGSLRAYAAARSLEKFYAEFMEAGQPALDLKLIKSEWGKNALGITIVRLGAGVLEKDPGSFDERMGFSPFTGLTEKLTEVKVISARQSGPQDLQIAVQFIPENGPPSLSTQVMKYYVSKDEYFLWEDAYYPDVDESLTDVIRQAKK